MSSAADIIEVYNLTAHGWSVGVAPASGTVISCDYEQCEVLRRTKFQGGRDENLFGVSHFPLAPYSNRIRDGRFEFDGKLIRIEPNASGHAHPLHGTAWLGTWSTISRHDDSVTLEYKNRSDHGWPWAFTLRQSIVLQENALSIELVLRNQADTPMPAGLGFHPYFADPDDAILKFAAKGFWLSDGAGLPDEWRAASSEWDFSAGRSLKGASFDHCYTGWDGRAFIEWRDKPFAIEMTADAMLNFAVLYVSEAENCFCFEPVSQMNDALNWARKRLDTGLRVLQPEEEWATQMTLRVRKKAK